MAKRYIRLVVTNNVITEKEIVDCYGFTVNKNLYIMDSVYQNIFDVLSSRVISLQDQCFELILFEKFRYEHYHLSVGDTFPLYYHVTSDNYTIY